MKYMHKMREDLGGYQPIRFDDCKSLQALDMDQFSDFTDGIDELYPRHWLLLE